MTHLLILFFCLFPMLALADSGERGFIIEYREPTTCDGPCDSESLCEDATCPLDDLAGTRIYLDILAEEPTAAIGEIVQVNFQTPDAVVPSGYLKDDGAMYSLARGYGWDRSVSTRDRNRHEDQRLDTFIHLESGVATWQYNLPNGSYEVSLASGDPSYAQGPHHLTVEGVVVIDNKPTPANEFITVTKHSTMVSDGQLTIQLSHSTANNTLLNYVIIESPALFSTVDQIPATAKTGGGTISKKYCVTILDDTPVIHTQVTAFDESGNESAPTPLVTKPIIETQDCQIVPTPNCTTDLEIVDSQKRTWTIGANRETLRDGVHMGNGSGDQYFLADGVMYVLAGLNWYQWDEEQGWENIGQTKPQCQADITAPDIPLNLRLE